MNIAIYQINPDRDENNVAFLNYENLERFQGSAALRSEIYDKVFEGEVECGTLEEVYQKYRFHGVQLRQEGCQKRRKDGGRKTRILALLGRGAGRTT